MADTITRSDDVKEVLRLACARRELLILATPYLRFESSFVGIQDGELHVHATMSRDDAMFGLRTPDLRLRFPDGLGFFEAKVEMKGLGLLDGKRTVRLSLPKTLQENDQRSGYRVERVGRVTVTYGTLKGDLSQGSLVDISTTGARVHAQRDVDPGAMAPGTPLLLSIPLAPDIQIEARAEIRHAQSRTIGLAFRPSLPPALEQPLSRWVFLRREEARERLSQRLDVQARSAAPKGQRENGILLVGGDAALEESLAGFLSSIRPLTRVPASAQPLKDALAAGASLAIFHVGGASLDEKRRLRALVELAQGKVPILLLATQVDGTTLFELSGECRASSAMVWNPERGLFLQRLAQGIIRRHTHGGDSPMAPAEG